VVSDADPYEAAEVNRLRARLCLQQARWPASPGFVDVESRGGDHHGTRVSRIHGQANAGQQGGMRHTYEVLVYANEFLQFGKPLQPLHRRLYAWELLFPIRRTETFEVAASNFCRLLRNWPNGVFLHRHQALGLSVPIAQEAVLEDYLDRLLELKDKDDQVVSVTAGPQIGELDKPFLPPSFPA